MKSIFDWLACFLLGNTQIRLYYCGTMLSLNDSFSSCYWVQGVKAILFMSMLIHKLAAKVLLTLACYFVKELSNKRHFLVSIAANALFPLPYFMDPCYYWPFCLQNA